MDVDDDEKYDPFDTIFDKINFEDEFYEDQLREGTDPYGSFSLDADKEVFECIIMNKIRYMKGFNYD